VSLLVQFIFAASGIITVSTKSLNRYKNCLELTEKEKALVLNIKKANAPTRNIRKYLSVLMGFE